MSEPHRFPVAPRKAGILRQYTPSLGWVQQVLDLLLAEACLYLAALYKFEGTPPDQYRILYAVVAVCMVATYQWTGVYHGLRQTSLWLEARGLLKGWLTLLFLLFGLAFVTKTNTWYSREVMFWFTLFGYLTQIAFHAGLRWALSATRLRGYNVRRALLVGSGPTAEQFARRVRRNPWLGIELAGFVGEAPSAGNAEASLAGSSVGRSAVAGGMAAAEAVAAPAPSEETALGGLPRLGGLADLEAVVARHRVRLVYITLPLGETHRIEDLVRTLMPLNVDVHWVPDMSSFYLINHSLRELEGQPIVCLSDAPVSGAHRLGKWLEDKGLAVLTLVLGAPLMALIALGVKLSSRGPVLFKQYRAGLNGEPIRVYKFRTMHLHDDQPGRVTQARADDPRVFPFGRFLRATSLDELPQFYNVLQGRMSVVGPRPHALEHDNYYEKQIEAYMLRHRIKPGITGWAQVNGYRGETETIDKMVGRVKYDLYYINNWSLWLDLMIILMTLWAVVTGRNAY